MRQNYEGKHRVLVDMQWEGRSRKKGVREG